LALTKQNARPGNQALVRVGASLGELEDLYRTRYRHFLRVAMVITGDRERAQDAVQEAFASAVRSRADYRGEGPLEAWVWRSVINAARQQAVDHRQRLEFGEQPTSANGTPPDENAVRRWIAALPERQRLAVFLRFYADLDYRAIASALEIEVGTVSATLGAAYVSLRKSLREVQQ
jgi:RNA polymerase sigma-70 factor, ECF subfamily